ncbi:MAG TPA: alpha-D-ribose 1-methylphosphonate 5-triphosphate diphosphatase [Magnetospirillaceae bacterium]|jgi:alpha-D-ribose 1-methylphosphonate 5-triphosphate diphosphatase
MSRETIYTNAQIVLRDRVLHGTVRVVDGKIGEIDEKPAQIETAIDCEGDYLLPGLIELHTDNLEKHFMPRPKVTWPAAAAVMAHDAQMAAAGITTVFDALACGEVDPGGARVANLQSMVTAVGETQARGHLRVDHRLHLRCEVSWAPVVGTFEKLTSEPLLGIVSVMDHSPGQRQFIHEDKYRTYYMGKYHLDSAEMDAFTVHQKEASARFSAVNRRAIADACREKGLILASHDDATLDHVAEAADLGTRFAEFPTTLDAARASHDAGMMVLMGAPNLVRGGSHSGNISASTLAEAGCLDVLSSDYVPISLIHAAFMLHRGPFGIGLPEAVATVTATPAAVTGLSDRGVIETGRRADLVRVLDTGDAPVIRAVWREGRQVA